MKQADVNRLVSLLSTPGSLSYNEENKEFFMRKGKALLKEVAQVMGLTPEQYEVRTNRGGIAVSGEVTLHADHVYFQLSQSVIGDAAQLVRGCRNQKDYSGYANAFLPVSILKNVAKLAEVLNGVFQGAQSKTVAAPLAR